MKEKQYDFVKQRLGPCGLHCGKCFAFADGEIAALSRQLKDALGNFDIYAQRFAGMLDEQPVFLQYPAFKAFLQYLTEVECGGCRKEKCKLFKTCNARPCSEEKGVDFCFACDEFPCENTGFNENLYKRHVEINKRMKEIGAEQYYEEIKTNQDIESS